MRHFNHYIAIYVLIVYSLNKLLAILIALDGVTSLSLKEMIYSHSIL